MSQTAKATNDLALSQTTANELAALELDRQCSLDIQRVVGGFRSTSDPVDDSIIALRLFERKNKLRRILNRGELEVLATVNR